MDLYSDCDDESDEDLLYHGTNNCSEGYHLCDDQVECIHEDAWCDGRSDVTYSYDGWYGAPTKQRFGCMDGSDESHCEDYECLPYQWKCADNRLCIAATEVCNREQVFGCHDGSDEHNTLCGCPHPSDWKWLGGGDVGITSVLKVKMFVMVWKTAMMDQMKIQLCVMIGTV